MKLYNECRMKDFLWITVLYSGEVKWWPCSLNLSTTWTGGNKWCRQCWGIRILLNKSSSAFSIKSETLRLLDIYPNLLKRLNIASTLPLSSADMNPPQAGRAYTICDTMRVCNNSKLMYSYKWKYFRISYNSYIAVHRRCLYLTNATSAARDPYQYPDLDLWISRTSLAVRSTWPPVMASCHQQLECCVQQNPYNHKNAAISKAVTAYKTNGKCQHI